MIQCVATLLISVVVAFAAVEARAQSQGAATPEAPASSAAVGSSSQAVVPRLMRFSGVLRDSAGKPMTGPVEVAFALYSSDASGDPLWSETQSVQTDDQGRYTALIGVMHTDGLPMDLFASGEARWLGVQVSHEPEQKPRVLLLSVPYALKASDAETLGGKPASAFVQTDAASGFSAGVAGFATGVAGTGGAGATNTGGPHAKPYTAGTGTQNYLAKWTDTTGDLGNSVIYDNGTTVGIGTTTPNATLDVEGGGNMLLGSSGTSTLILSGGWRRHRFVMSATCSCTWG